MASRQLKNHLRGAVTIEPQRRIIPREDHQVSRQNISPNCLKILYRLNEAGFESYIVGGGVRDLLLGLKPKDFDIATDATPEEVKALFRNSRIIGRRFRIVHVHFGREIIEVSTFRASNSDTVIIEGDSLSRKVTHLDSAHSSQGMILRDNVYGDISGDVTRRDFTVNALYYTVRNFEIHDYFNGLSDIQARTLRMIGDPTLRYREDPVRILRAIRLAAKLGFSIEAQTAAPIRDCLDLLDSVPAARLFDEFMKLFFSGHALTTFHRLLEYDAFQKLFPDSAPHLDMGGFSMRLLEKAFESTDERIRQDKSVTPSFLLAAILWPAAEQLYRANLECGMKALPAMHEAAQSVISSQLESISVPKRFTIPMREIWEYQLRLQRRNGKRAEAMLHQRRFRAAYDFLLLRESAGEDLQGLGNWWTEYQQGDNNEREKMQARMGRRKHHSKVRRRKVKSKQPATGS